MAETLPAAIRFIVQSRVVSKSCPNTPWSRIPTLFKDYYAALQFRDEYAAFIASGGKGDKLGAAFLALSKELLSIDNGHFETRIIKRTIQDEIIEAVERIDNG